MPIVRLSPRFVRQVSYSSEHKKIDYFDATMRGFMLEVRASGGKPYYQRYTDERGRERQVYGSAIARFARPRHRLSGILNGPSSVQR
jgi:hypothetical protein